MVYGVDSANLYTGDLDVEKIVEEHGWRLQVTLERSSAAELTVTK